MSEYNVIVELYSFSYTHTHSDSHRLNQYIDIKTIFFIISSNTNIYKVL